MKDLKFRAWHKEFEKYYEVVQLGLSRGFKHAILFDDAKDLEFPYEMCDHEEIILEQCVGFKDDLGKEIYVGDILGAEHKLLEQSFIGECVLSIEYGILIYDGHGEEHYYVPQNFGYRVLGNVHENKELLNV